MLKNMKFGTKCQSSRIILIILIIGLFASIFIFNSFNVRADTVICHRCGMEWEKEKAIIASVNNQSWYECCPICALMDIIEHGEDNTEHQMIAKCETTNETITIQIKNGNVLYSDPSNPIILYGGTCETNKVFKDNETADAYIIENNLDHPIYTIQKAIDLIVKSKIEKKKLCVFCNSEIQNNLRVIFTLHNGSSYKFCCYQCANNMYESLKDHIKSIAVADYISADLIDANIAYFVKESYVSTKNDQDSWIAFDSMISAYEFRGMNGGSVIKGWKGNSVLCLNCGMLIQPKLATIILLEDGKEKAYCPGCPDAALERLGNQVSAVFVGDYDTGLLLDGFNAYYVNNYDIDIPGTMGGHRIAFSSIEKSQKFVDEYGGIVVDWNGNVVYGQNLYISVIVIILIFIIIILAVRSLLIIHSKHKQLFEKKTLKSGKIDKKLNNRRRNHERKEKKKKN